MAILSAIFCLRPGRGLARRLLAVLLALTWLAGARAAAPATPTAEYQVKAAFLFNFAQFVEWPAKAFPDEQAPIIVGVLGEDPFGSYLDELVQNEKIGNRPLVVRRYRRVEDVADCHILFISRSAGAQFDKTIASLRGRPLLTVGDLDNFCRLGGMVRFVTENGKIRLRVNIESAKDSGLTISSKLLRWATIVTPEKG